MALVEFYFSSPPASHAGVFFGACIYTYFACVLKVDESLSNPKKVVTAGRTGGPFVVDLVAVGCLRALFPPMFCREGVLGSGQGRACQCRLSGLWLATIRLRSIHTHGTWCTLRTAESRGVSLRAVGGDAA